MDDLRIANLIDKVEDLNEEMNRVRALLKLQSDQYEEGMKMMERYAEDLIRDGKNLR